MSFEASTKSAEAFRTISEVAVELDLPQHVLRFWEGRFPQVHPLKRAGGRRYYRPEDVDLLRGIHKLLYGEGLTIRGVQKILREQGVRYVSQLGRGEIHFMTPLNRRRPRPVADAEYALQELASLHLEFSQPAEAVEAIPPLVDEMIGRLDEDAEEPVEATREQTAPETDETAWADEEAPDDPFEEPVALDRPESQGGNVHAFPRAALARRLSHEQRARLHELLRELMNLKMQLRQAKTNCRAIAGLL